MIQKRNISTFAAVLALMAFMLLSASPAKAFKTTNPDMAAAYDQCLTNNYQGKAKKVKQCFEDIRTTYAEACFVDAQAIDYAEEQTLNDFNMRVRNMLKAADANFDVHLYVAEEATFQLARQIRNQCKAFSPRAERGRAPERSSKFIKD